MDNAPKLFYILAWWLCTWKELILHRFINSFLFTIIYCAAVA